MLSLWKTRIIWVPCYWNSEQFCRRNTWRTTHSDLSFYRGWMYIVPCCTFLHELCNHSRTMNIRTSSTKPQVLKAETVEGFREYVSPQPLSCHWVLSANFSNNVCGRDIGASPYIFAHPSPASSWRPPHKGAQARPCKKMRFSVLPLLNNKKLPFKTINYIIVLLV